MSQKNQSKVTLRRVAEVAGVSLGTASNVFANKPGVATSTRQAVLSIASELGYQPAHSLPAGASAFPSVTALGFVVRSLPLPLLANLFYSYVLHGEEEVCREHGISLMYAAVDENARSLEQLPAMLQQKQVQGLLVVGYFHPSFYELLRSLELPFVTVDHYLDSLDVDSVVNDDEQGGYTATRYMLERVHRPIPAIISDLHTHASIYHRWRGYRRALDELHLPYDERYVYQGFPANEFAYKSMKALLQLEVPPNAVFCCGDVMAMEALKALQDSGISVPDECAVIGFDDLPLASHTTPTLTTMKVDIELLGKEGTRSLLERIKYPEMATRRTVLSVKLLERESVSKKPV
jgi:LacI family transcriptional regulator